MPRLFITDLSGGLNQAFAPHRIKDNELSLAENIVFRGGSWVKRPGVFSPHGSSPDSNPVIEIGDFIKRNGTTFLFAVTTNRIYSISGTTWTQEKLYGTTRSTTNKVFYAEIGDALYVTDGINPIQRATTLGGTGDNFADMTWDTSPDPQGNVGITINSARVILAFNSRLLFFGTDSSTDGLQPHRMYWTEVLDFDRVETFNFLDLDYSQTPIISARPLASGLIAVYKPDSISTIQDTGNPPFTPRFRTSIGLLAPKALADTPFGHFFVSNDGFYLFNGGLPRPIGDDRVSSKFFELLNFDKKDNVYAFTSFKDREVYVMFPTGTSDEPNAIYVWNYQYDTWTMFTLSGYCGFYQYRTLSSPKVFFGRANGGLKVQGGTTDDGNQIATKIRTKSFMLVPIKEATLSYAHIQEVVTDVSPSTASVNVFVGDFGSSGTEKVGTIQAVVSGRPVRAEFSEFARYAAFGASSFDSISEFVCEWQPGGIA